MPTINVNLQQRSYPITIAGGNLTAFIRELKPENSGNWVIITHPDLADYYGNTLSDSLKNAGFRTDIITISAGEKAKSIRQMEKLYSQLVALQCDRKTTLAALGGGVVGDVTGFLAATYMRGIQYVQVPTTLLSMIDSSIGGKTGVNLPEGKNLVGAFHQPQQVVIDPDLLKTLPLREKVSGFAELIKYGLIWDQTFFNTISSHTIHDVLDNDTLLMESIAKSCETKAKIVSKDEFESDLRRILNFGHTIGHAFETLCGNDRLRHGEAVAFGMLCAGYISFKKGLLDKNEWQKMERTIRDLPLPTIDFPEAELILNTIKHDKKNTGRTRNFVLLNRIGNAVVSDQVSDHDIISSLEVL